MHGSFLLGVVQLNHNLLQLRLFCEIKHAHSLIEQFGVNLVKTDNQLSAGRLKLGLLSLTHHRLSQDFNALLVEFGLVAQYDGELLEQQLQNLIETGKVLLLVLEVVVSAADFVETLDIFENFFARQKWPDARVLAEVNHDFV